jgi:hypothetical protein
LLLDNFAKQTFKIKNLMKKLIIFFIIAFSPGLFAQSIERYVISSCGGSYFDGSSVSLDYTAGEFAITTISNSTNIMTQGFHQPFINYYVSVQENSGNQVQVDIYPNPVVDQLYIEVSNAKDEDLRICMYDILGQLVVDESAKSDMTGMIRANFNMTDLSTGNYFVRVMQGKEVITTKKIIKINQ